MDAMASFREELAARIETHSSMIDLTDSPVVKGVLRELRWALARVNTLLAVQSATTPPATSRPSSPPLPRCLPERTHAWMWDTDGDEYAKDRKTCKHCQHVRDMDHGDKVVAGRERSMSRKVEEATRQQSEKILESAGILVDLSS